MHAYLHTYIHTYRVDPPIPRDDYPLSYTFGYYDSSGNVKYAHTNKHTYMYTYRVDPPIPRDDYPLSYTFGYYDSSSDVKYFATSSSRAIVSSVLPSGTDRYFLPV